MKFKAIVNQNVMKTQIISLLFFMSVFAYGKNINYTSADTSQLEFRDITHIVSVDLFESIKTFVLTNGDRETYSSMYGNNPHYSFDGFESYLNPDIGQLNADCDTSKSDFNEIVIRDQNADTQYYYIRIVRKGDIVNEQIITYEGTSEEKVYLRNSNDHDMDSMVINVSEYIDIIKNVLTTDLKFFQVADIDNIVVSNPATGFFTISIPTGKAGKYLLRLIDLQGRIVLFKEVEIAGSYRLDLPATKPGIYILKIKNETTVVSKRIILQ